MCCIYEASFKPSKLCQCYAPIHFITSPLQYRPLPIDFRKDSALTWPEAAAGGLIS